MKKRDWVKEKIVSIDFDGVLSTYNGWKGKEIMGIPLPGAKKFIVNLIDSGYTPVVFTTRNPKLIIHWLSKFDFPDIEVTNIKYPSVVYIDDRNVKFEGNFSQLVADLKAYKVYWRKKSDNIFDGLKNIQT